MARLTGFPVPNKAPSLSGNFLISTWRGVPYLMSWPRKRGKPKSVVVQRNTEKFRQIGKIIPYLNWQQHKAAREASQGTPFYPRDVLTMMMYGTLLAWRDPNGKIIYSMQTRLAVSESLDVLSQDDGAILARKNGLWVPVESSELHAVLTNFNDDDSPRYEPVGPNVGGHMMTDIDGGGASTSSNATKGWYVEPTMNVGIDRLSAHINTFPGQSYKAWIFELNGFQVSSIIYSGNTQSSVITAAQIYEWIPGSTIQLAAGTRYAFAISRTDGSGSSPLQIFGSGANTLPAFPSNRNLGFFTDQRNNYVGGETFGFTQQGSQFQVNLIYRF